MEIRLKLSKLNEISIDTKPDENSSSVRFRHGYNPDVRVGFDNQINEELHESVVEFLTKIMDCFGAEVRRWDKAQTPDTNGFTSELKLNWSSRKTLVKYSSGVFLRTVNINTLVERSEEGLKLETDIQYQYQHDHPSLCDVWFEPPEFWVPSGSSSKEDHLRTVDIVSSTLTNFQD